MRSADQLAPRVRAAPPAYVCFRALGAVVPARAQAGALLPPGALRNDHLPPTELVHEVEDVAEVLRGLVGRPEAVLVQGVAQIQPGVGVAPGAQPRELVLLVCSQQRAEQDLVAELERTRHRLVAEVHVLVERRSLHLERGLGLATGPQIHVVGLFVRRAGAVRGQDLDEAKLPVRVDEDYAAFGGIERFEIHDSLRVEL